ncbi:MAG: hypothetical protein ACP5O3_01830 [Candidatus Micrarchaeia archaeon]|jgi:uncharacterized membrane protein
MNDKIGWAAAAVFLLVVGWLGWTDFVSAVDSAKPWVIPVVVPGEVEAIKWLGANTPARATIMYDIFGGETLMALVLRAPPVGGDWTTSPDAVQRMSDVTRFYVSSSAAEAHEIAVKYGASYAVVPSRQVHCGFGWESVQAQKFSDANYFEKVFGNEGAVVYKVK